MSPFYTVVFTHTINLPADIISCRLSSVSYSTCSTFPTQLIPNHYYI